MYENVKAVFKNHPGIIFISDFNGDVLEFLTPETGLPDIFKNVQPGKNIFTELPGDVSRIFEKNLNVLKEEESSCSFEIKGEDFPVSYHISLSAIDETSPEKILVTIQEKSRSKTTENIPGDEGYLFQTLMDNIPDSIFFKDLESRFIRINKACADKFGLNDSSEAIGKTDFDFFGKVHAEKALHDEKEVIKSGKPIIAVEEKEVFNDGSGTESWANTTKLPLYNQRGEIIGTFGISRDVTDQKLAELKLIQQKNRLDSVINSTDDLVFAVDSEYRLLIFNNQHAKRMKDIYGVEIEVGKSILRYIQSAGDDIPAKENFERAFKGEQFTKIQKYGDEKLERTYFELTFNPIERPGSDEIEGVAVFIQDMTEQIKWEKALSKSEEKYRKIFENVQDIFYQTDKKGIITEVSPSIKKYSGFTRNEVIGKHVSEFYYYDNDREELLEKLEKDGEVVDFEVRLKTKSGELTYASLNAHYTLDEKENISGIEGHMRDINERKKAEEEIVKINKELAELNRQKDKLFSVVAHDLRNPISGFISTLDILHEDFGLFSKEELYKYLTLLKKSSRELHIMLEDLLMWARNQFESVSVEPVVLCLYDVTKHIENNLSVQAKEKEINFENNIPDDINLKADEEMVKTIFRNLFGNAIKFSHPGGKIEVSAEIDDNEVLISVRDEGIGIEPDEQEKIFNKATVFTKVGTQGEKGSGLGLDICKDFVEKHNGEIRFESEPGEGTTFYVTLPKA